MGDEKREEGEIRSTEERGGGLRVLRSERRRKRLKGKEKGGGGQELPGSNSVFSICLVLIWSACHVL